MRKAEGERMPSSIERNDGCGIHAGDSACIFVTFRFGAVGNTIYWSFDEGYGRSKKKRVLPFNTIAMCLEIYLEIEYSTTVETKLKVVSKLKIYKCRDTHVK